VQQAAGTRVITSKDWGRDLGIVLGTGSCTPLIWPGVGVLGPASSTIRLRHPSEAAYYVMNGPAQVEDHNEGTAQALETGSMFHIEAGTAYTITAVGEPVTILGGPCPPDPAMYVPHPVPAAPEGP
jgi:mannose-6-phosphate isomerase-like protein (cupin superfamily)